MQAWQHNEQLVLLRVIQAPLYLYTVHSVQYFNRYANFSLRRRKENFVKKYMEHGDKIYLSATCRRQEIANVQSGLAWLWSQPQSQLWPQSTKK